MKHDRHFTQSCINRSRVIQSEDAMFKAVFCGQLLNRSFIASGDDGTRPALDA
jgi:hypothetical protein